MPKHLNSRPLYGVSLRILYWLSLKDLDMNGNCKDDSPGDFHEPTRSGLREIFFYNILESSN